MTRIFMSYRRDDSAGYTGRLHDKLSAHFGTEAIFLDIGTIEPGEDFVVRIERAVSTCDVLLAVIGKQWLTITDSNDQRRLDDPEDFVRLEIAAALKRNIRVIPVLVGRASMPDVAEVPDDLKALTRRNAHEISDSRFDYDVDVLIQVLEKVLSTPEVFVSYAHADRDFVDRLIADLQDQGLNVWVDKLGLKVGNPDWEEAIRDALQQVKAVVLVATPHSRRSRYVRDELAVGEAEGKPICIVWTSGERWIESIPLGYGTAHYIDLRGESYGAGVTQLVAVLHDGAALKAKPTPVPPVTDQAEVVIESPAEPRNPYKGLRPFRAADRQDFFGREALINELVGALREKPGIPRLLTVVGPSGSGKSSVVMAGLLPRLQAGALDGSSEWVYVDPLVPGTYPLENLTIALSKHLREKAQRTIREDLDDPSSRGLHRLAQQIITEEDQRLVVYVDQFEELFTLTAEEGERQQFIDLLTTAACEPNGPVAVILTLRADFLDRPMHYRELGELVETHSKAVLPMTLADLYDVVQKPAALPDVQVTFDESLVTELVYAVRDQLGALPLLQFTLDQLFERREGQQLTRHAYDVLGGVQGALAQHAETTFEQLPTHDHRRLAQALFLRLIEPGEAEQDTTRRRININELELIDETETRLLRESMDAFIAARLLVADHVGETTTVEVSHEALIREWGRLGEWLHIAREDVRMQQAISADAAAWARRGSQPHDDALYRGAVLAEAQSWAERNVASTDEMSFITASAAKAEREHRRQRVLMGALLGLALTIPVLIAIFFAIQSRTEARNAAKLTQELNRVESLRLGGLADDILEENGNPEVAALLGIRALEVAYSPQADAALVRALDQTASRVFNDRDNYMADVDVDSFSMIFSPDGQFVLTGSFQNTTQLWDARTGEEVEFFTSSYYAPAAFSPDGRYMLLNSHDETWLLDARTGEEVRSFPVNSDVLWSAAFSPDGQQFLISGHEAPVLLWDIETGEELQTFGISGDVMSLAFSPDGQQVLTGSYDGTAQLWDAQTGEELRVFTASEEITSVAFSPDGRSVLIGSRDGTVQQWDARNGEPLRTFFNYAHGTISAVFSPDGRYVLTGGCENAGGICHRGMAQLWDAQTGEQLQALTDYAYGIISVAFSPDGQQVLTANEEGFVRLWNAAYPDELENFVGHTGQVAFNPDGQQVLTGGCDEFGGSTCVRGTARLWDVQTGAEIRAFPGQAGGVWGVAFSPDGQQILTGSEDGTVWLWDAQTGEQVRTFTSHTGKVTQVAFSPDGRSVLTNSADGTARLWDAQTGAEVRTTGFAGMIPSVAFSSDGRYVLTGSEDGTARLWDAQTSKELRQFTSHTKRVTSVAFSPPDGRYVLTGSEDGTARLWDTETGEQLRVFTGHTAPVWSVAFSPDGRYVLTGAGQEGLPEGEDTTARLWDVETGAEIRQFTGHTGIVWSVAFSPDGRYVLTGAGSHEGGADSTARLWDIKTGAEVLTFAGHEVGVWSVAFSPDGRYVLTGGCDILTGHGGYCAGGTARLWDARTGEEVSIVTQFDEPWEEDSGVTSVAFSPDGDFVLTGGCSEGYGDPFCPNGTVRLWDVTTNDQIHTFTGYSAVFSPDGRYVLTSGDCGEFWYSDDTCVPVIGRLWDAVSGGEVRTFSSFRGQVTSATFSPDGQSILMGGEGGTLLLSEAATGRELRSFIGHTSAVVSVGFSPDERYIVAGGEDGTVRLWDNQTGEGVRTFTGHTAAVVSVAFSPPDGRYVLTGSEDGTARLWNVQTGEGVRTFTGHTAAVVSVAFSPPDGRYVLTGSADGTVRLWDSDYLDFITYACAHGFPDLTEDERWLYTLPDDQPTCPPGR